MKKIAIGLLLFLCSVADAKITLPKPSGFVNDFAGLLSEEQKSGLESKLREYEKKTSIEIAVVTVNSLEGLDVWEYTEELVRLPDWKVGKAGKDNGLVFLIAPNERKMRIHSGRGIEPDLTDTKAKYIIEDEVIPFFKKKRMDQGILSGIDAVIRDLGDKQYAKRLEEREAERIKESENRLRREAEDSMARKVYMVLAFFAAILLLLVGLVIRTLIRRHKIKEASAYAARIPGLVSKAEKNLAHEDVQECTRTRRLASICKSAEDVARRAAIASPNWLLLYDRCSELESEINDAIQDAEDEKRLARTARTEGPKMADRLPRLIARAEKKTAKKGVSKSARSLVDKAKGKFKEVQPSLKKSPVDWLMAYAALSAIESLLSKAEDRADEDLEPPMSSYSSGSSWSSGGGSSDSSFGGGFSSGSSSGGGFSSGDSSGGGFGGFSGGDFGGGGASGSW